MATTDTTARNATSRQALDARVAKAQADALEPAKPETQAQRDARIRKDRQATIERAEAVQAAQEETAHAGRRALEALTPAEREKARAEARQAVLDRQAAMDAAVDAENARQRGEAPA